MVQVRHGYLRGPMSNRLGLSIASVFPKNCGVFGGSCMVEAFFFGALGHGQLLKSYHASSMSSAFSQPHR